MKIYNKPDVEPIYFSVDIVTTSVTDIDNDNNEHDIDGWF